MSLYLRYLLAAKEKGKQDLSVQCLLKLMICAHKTDNAGKVIRAPNYIQGCGSLDHGVGVQEEELLVRGEGPEVGGDDLLGSVAEQDDGAGWRGCALVACDM